MFELRPFDGTADELQRFVVASWSASYHGKMPFPLWTREYFEWNFGLSEGLPRDHLVAAYEGTRLVGTLLGLPFTFQLGGQEFSGTLGSWLSVDPDYRRQRLGTLLRDEMLATHRRLGLKGQVGYIFEGSSLSLGQRFWKPRAAAQLHRLARAGFWVRVFDAPRIAAWNCNPLEAFAIRLSQPFTREPPAVTEQIVRKYQPSDLTECLNLVNRTARQTECAMIWNEVDLERHLHGRGVGSARVLLRQGQVYGVCSFHCLPFQGRTVENVGVIDLLSGPEMTRAEAVHLLNAVMGEMRRQGASMVLRLRTSDVPWTWMAATLFLPRPADSTVCFSAASPDAQQFPVARSLSLLWR